VWCAEVYFLSRPVSPDQIKNCRRRAGRHRVSFAPPLNPRISNTLAKRVRLRHLALLCARHSHRAALYEAFFGFDQGDSEWFGDVLFVRNDEGFDLAFMKGDHPPNPGAFHHFGFQLPDRESVSTLHQRLIDARVPIIELVDESAQYSFKCVDPDGYTSRSTPSRSAARKRANEVQKGALNASGSRGWTCARSGRSSPVWPRLSKRDEL